MLHADSSRMLASRSFRFQRFAILLANHTGILQTQQIAVQPMLVPRNQALGVGRIDGP